MSGEETYRSVAELFFDRVAKTPDAEAFSFPSGDGIKRLTWAETADRVTALAAGLIDLGVQPEDRVAIMSGTRIEWVLADTAIMCAAAATTTVYPTTEPADAAFILADSGSTVVFAEDATQVSKIEVHRNEIPALKHIVTFDEEAAGDGVLSLAELEERGRARLAEDPQLVARTAKGIEPVDLATLIYTSGTTGKPKGVRLIHANWVWQARCQVESGLIGPDDVQYLWLPLAHSFGKTLLCGTIQAGAAMYVDGRIDKIVDNLAIVRPTLMAGAPRIFEKVYNRVVSTTRDAGGAKWKIFSWAFGVGRKVVALRQQGKQPTGLLAFQHKLADKLVFSKIRDRFGGRINVMISGAAPLSPEIAEFFHAAGLRLLEGYGLTETSAGAFVNLPEDYRIGTVGKPMGDLEVKLDSDGEILVKSQGVMTGYHNLPEETAAVFTEDGYFRTGDIGELDSDGFLKITDRKKDLVKTSGGKYIAPSYIEGQFKALCPYASQVVVVARNFCTMLITLDPDAIRGWADGHGLEGVSYDELVEHPDVRALIQESIDQLNPRLNRWERIQKFTILPADLTVESGELTPSMKVRRKAVEEKYGAQLAAMYEGSLAEL
ncbi:MAG TPA: long-chain fatty acid--CoA ligase [Cryptosporangiaceae bacterium]|nr:long-chain fatty acid--CoA ligase [Cryptosporangiaceae bacterium]